MTGRDYQPAARCSTCGQVTCLFMMTPLGVPSPRCVRCYEERAARIGDRSNTRQEASA